MTLKKSLATLLLLASAAHAAPTLAQRTAAARATAQDAADCQAVQPFYWSIGDAHGVLADGSAGRRPPTATTPMPIASASKLVYAAFVAEQRHGQLTDDDVRFLHFTSGYTHFRSCRRGQTVGECDAMRENGVHDPAEDGKFFYNGGHMQQHAVREGLGSLDDRGLANRINAALGTSFEYMEPQLAGGIRASAADYGEFLRRIVAGQLQMKSLLGAHPVCTNPQTCPTAAESVLHAGVHYAIGHWVEDDASGDGAYSSAGAFGFYPWIDRQAQWWGVLARFDARVDRQPGPGVESLYCGREIRAAWLGGARR